MLLFRAEKQETAGRHGCVVDVGSRPHAAYSPRSLLSRGPHPGGDVMWSTAGQSTQHTESIAFQTNTKLRALLEDVSIPECNPRPGPQLKFPVGIVPWFFRLGNDAGCVGGKSTGTH